MQFDLPSGSSSNPDVESFQQLADGAPVMIWMSGTDLGCFYFNRAWLDFRGRTLQQESGNGWAEGVHPEDLEPCVQHYIGSFEKRVPFAMSYRLLHHAGDYRWILDRGAPHFDADGKFLGFYGGCAETHPDSTVERIKELRHSLHEMHEFAERHISGGRMFASVSQQRRIVAGQNSRNHSAASCSAKRGGPDTAACRRHAHLRPHPEGCPLAVSFRTWVRRSFFDGWQDSSNLRRENDRPNAGLVPLWRIDCHGGLGDVA